MTPLAYSDVMNTTPRTMTAIIPTRTPIMLSRTMSLSPPSTSVPISPAPATVNVPLASLDEPVAGVPSILGPGWPTSRSFHSAAGPGDNVTLSNVAVLVS